MQPRRAAIQVENERHDEQHGSEEDQGEGEDAVAVHGASLGGIRPYGSSCAANTGFSVGAARYDRGMIRDFFTGVGLLGRGLATWSTSPRLMLTGALPALIVALVYTAGFVVLAVNSPGLAEWITPFADHWPEPWRTLTRVSAALALVAVALLVIVFTFTAITLAVGDIFYERIWRTTEERLGDAPPEPQGGFWKLLWRGIVTGARILALTIVIGLLLFVVGLVPVVGQVASPVLAALFGGWVLSLELTGFAFDARGVPLRGRRRMLDARRSRTLGFGVATYLLFLIPLGAVFVMPAAVVGATQLARRAHDEAGRHPEG